MLSMGKWTSKQIGNSNISSFFSPNGKLQGILFGLSTGESIIHDLNSVYEDRLSRIKFVQEGKK